MPGRLRSRGRTRPGRLAFLDAYLAREERALLARAGAAPVLDVGVGDDAITTAEWVTSLAAVAPGLAVIGVDHDARRVEHNRRRHPDLRLMHADAASLQSLGTPARLVRAMNVCRGLRPGEAAGLAAAMAAALHPGGLLVEGNTDTDGGTLAVQLVRAGNGGPVFEGMLLRTDFARGFGPLMFRDRLPRMWRHGCPAGHPLRRFFSAWHDAVQAVAADHPEPRARFAAAAQRLAGAEAGVTCDDWLASQGALRWTPPGGLLPFVTPPPPPFAGGMRG